jgi:hypothetical protein
MSSNAGLPDPTTHQPTRWSRRQAPLPGYTTGLVDPGQEPIEMLSLCRDGRQPVRLDLMQRMSNVLDHQGLTSFRMG